MRIEQLRQRLQGLGASAEHQAHVLRRWAQARPQNSGRRRIDHYLPRALLAELPAIVNELAGLARLRSEHPGADGSARLLVELADDQTVESVLLSRGGLCVSTQVGCAVGCLFCMTGQGGLLRQLGSAEIVAQLALAPHTTKPALRTELLPRAPRIGPAELVEQGERYARATGYPIQYQWTLLVGINDGDDEVDGIVELLAGKYAIMNMIPYNSVEGLDFERPPAERAAAMALALNRRGVLTKLRQSAGQDLEGGCGQLRARTQAPGSRRIPIVAAAEPETLQ